LSGNQNWRCGDVWEETDRDKGLLWTLKAGVRNSRVDGLCISTFISLWKLWEVGQELPAWK
jgi:hypothetical protein